MRASESDANNTLSICLVPAKMSLQGGEGKIHRGRERKKADDSNKQAVPQPTFIMAVEVQFPNLSEGSNRRNDVR